ncbi:unnamed protein product [Heterosigma akashiwo]
MELSETHTDKSSKWEFYCDQCNFTVDYSEKRYECRLCPGEFLLCHECNQKMGLDHMHVLFENTGTKHSTPAKILY